MGRLVECHVSQTECTHWGGAMMWPICPHGMVRTIQDCCTSRVWGTSLVGSTIHKLACCVSSQEAHAAMRRLSMLAKLIHECCSKVCHACKHLSDRCLSTARAFRASTPRATMGRQCADNPDTCTCRSFRFWCWQLGWTICSFWPMRCSSRTRACPYLSGWGMPWLGQAPPSLWQRLVKPWPLVLEASQACQLCATSPCALLWRSFWTTPSRSPLALHSLTADADCCLGWHG